MANILGFIGVFMILLAYFLNLTGRLKVADLSYISLNLIGALLACIASLLMDYLPFVVLEGVWTLISLMALFRYFKK